MGRLFWKFFAAFWLALSLAGAGVGAMLWLRHAAEDAEQRQWALPPRIAEPMLDAAASTLAHGGIAALREFLQDWQRGRNPPLLAVDERGRDLLGREVDPELWQQAQRRSLHMRGHGVRSVAADGQQYLLFVVAPKNLPKPPGILPPPRKPPPPGWLIAIGLTASILFSGALAWYFAKPIRQLRGAFGQLAVGQLDSRVAAAFGGRRDELADLGRHFDHMAEQIQDLVAAQQRLLHDVSHQLRSPLARIQAALGLAQQQPDKLPQILMRLERETQRMDDLVGELLTWSRLATGVPADRVGDVDLAALLEEVAADASIEANAKGIRIVMPQPAECSIKGQGELLRRAVENVVRNAVQHSPEGGRVELACDYTAGQRQWRLQVRDDGPGVDPNELSAIFEPFFQGGGPRKEKSTGLGLSIARHAIAAHGGSIRAENRGEGGLCVTFRLPVAN